jgi:DNA sulfur modification protein DndD
MIELQQIKFNNWIPFYGKEQLIFSRNSEQNVTLIMADNQVGKTAILRGILWCMFNTTNDTSKYSTHLSRLNKKALSEKNFNYSVDLALKYNNQSYAIRRNSSSTSENANFTTELTLNIDGIDYSELEAQKEINKIFDLTTSRFYLFDGEMLTQYERLLLSNNMSALSKIIIKSVEDILQITSLNNAKTALIKVHKTALESFSDDQENDENIKKSQDRLLELIDERDDIDDEIKIFDESKKHLEGRIEECRKVFGDNSSKQDISGEYNELLKTISDTENHILELEHHVNTLSKDAHLALLENNKKNVIDNLEAKLSKAESNIKRFDKVNVLESLLADINISNNSKEVIKELMPSSNGKDKSALEDDIFTIKGKLKSIKNIDTSSASKNFLLLVEKNIELEKNKSELEENRIRSEQLLSLIGEEFVDVIQEAITNMQLYSEELGTINLQLDDGNEQGSAYKLKNLNKEINLIEASLDETETGTSLTAVTEKVSRAYKEFFSETINTMVVETKQKIEDEANKVYKELQQYRVLHEQNQSGLHLKINDTYGMNVINTKGEELFASAGGSQIVALSLIFALRNQLESEAPILMDTPLARLDTKFRRGILEKVPKYGTQFILLAHDGEIEPNSDLHKVLKPKIGKTYNLIKIDDDVTEIQEA